MVSRHNVCSWERTRPARPWRGRASVRGTAHGFTLVELMISLLLLAVLLGTGVPSFRSMMAEQRLRAISSDLRIALNTARSEAVKRNRNVVLSPSGSGWSGGWSIASPEPGDPAILNHPEATGVDITGPGTVAFNPMGRSTTADFDIGVSAVSGAELCLHMEIDGRATAAKGVCP